MTRKFKIMFENYEFLHKHGKNVDDIVIMLDNMADVIHVRMNNGQE